MAKLVITISAGVTAFIMALVAGAVFAYRTMSSPSTASTQQPASQVSSSVQVAAVDPTQAQPTALPNVSPQDAASIAAKSIKRTDVYSVAMADAKGTQAYMVTFTSGDVVYVGMQGQVLATLPPPTPAPAPAVVASGGGGGGGGGGGHSSGGGGGGGGEGEHDGGGD